MTDASTPAAPGKLCPICGKAATIRHKPFCSQRCTTIDLARWIAGDYRIPSEEVPEEPPPSGEDDEPA